MIKASLIVAIGLLATVLLRRRSASTRHWVLACSLICAALAPALELVVPAWNAPISLPWMGAAPAESPAVFGGEPDAAQPAPSQTGAAAPTASPSHALLSIGQAVWFTGAIASLFLLVAGLARLHRIVAQSAPVRNGPWVDALSDLSGDTSVAGVTLLQSRQPTLLFTWGVRRPTIVLPAGAPAWPIERIRAVLRHELAHVQRRDWMVQMLAELVRSAYWFNPLVWLACHHLRQISEQACDDAVLNAGVNASDYATHLVDVAHLFTQAPRHSLLPVMTMCRPSSFEKRVRVMLKSGIDRSPISRLAGLATAAALLLLTMPLAGLSPAPATAPPSIGVERIVVVPPPPGGEASAKFQVPTGHSAPPPTTDRQAEAMIPVIRGDVEPTPQAASVANASVSGVLMDATGRAMTGVPMVLERIEISLKVVRTPADDGHVRIASVPMENLQRVEIQTDNNGYYSVGGLGAGDYQVRITKPGFVSKQTPIVLSAGQQLKHDIVAQIGSLEEMIVIAAPSTASPAAAPTPRRVAEESAKPDPCDNSPVGGCLTPPRKLIDMKPVYPPVLAASGVSATVVAKATLGLDGLLRDFEPEVGPDTAFVQAVLDALRQWQFSTVRLNGSPQECQVTVKAQFATGRD